METMLFELIELLRKEKRLERNIGEYVIKQLEEQIALNKFHKWEIEVEGYPEDETIRIDFYAETTDDKLDDVKLMLSAAEKFMDFVKDINYFNKEPFIQKIDTDSCYIHLAIKLSLDPNKKKDIWKEMGDKIDKVEW